MHGRRRRTAVGLVLAAVVGAGWLALDEGPADPAAAADAPAVVAGAVTGAGTPIGPATGWEVTRSDPGRYELRFARDVALTVESWDVAAEVLIRPVAAGTFAVSFDVDRVTPVDAAFTFTAVATD